MSGAVKVIGLLLCVVGFLLSLMLSVSILIFIGATIIMWFMWIAQLFFMILGAVLMQL